MQVPTLTDADADQLAQAVGDLLLAVAQAAGLIAETGIPPSEYLRLLNDCTTEVLSEGNQGRILSRWPPRYGSRWTG